MNLSWLCRATYTVAVGVFIAHGPPLAAQSVLVMSEYKLKAAFVYNFALFTEWPAGRLGEGGTLTICMYPNGEWLSALIDGNAKGNNKTAKGRHTVVQLLTDSETLHHCHALILTSLDRSRWGQIKHSVENTSVLTISEDAEISRDGAIVALYVDKDRVGFDVDMNAAHKAKLVLSSKLLRLARTVERYYE